MSATREQPLEAELEERRRALHRADELLAGSSLPHVGGIASGREIGDLELHLEALLPLVAALGRGLARGVGVVRERDLAREVLQREEVLVGERGAARRDRDRARPASANAMTSV